MTWFARLAAVALGTLAVLGGVLWVDVVDRYVAVSEVRVTLWQHVGFADVVIPPITSDDQVVTVGILFRVGNPTEVPVEVTSISYRFYMDNLTDTRPFPDKDDTIFVAVGGFFASEAGETVPPRSVGLIWANMTVRGATQPETLQRLNLTFFGRYYPIIDAGLVYRVPGTAVVDRVVGLVFATEGGVLPRAP